MPMGEGEEPITRKGIFRGVPISISVTLYVAGALTMRVMRMVNSTSWTFTGIIVMDIIC